MLNVSAMLKVSELAKRAGVTPDTVRFYTRQGLLTPARDPDNGYQLYQARDLQRLTFAKKARQLGFTLKEISEILAEADEDQSPCPLVRDLFSRKLALVEQQIAELTQLRDRMADAMHAWQHMPDGSPDGQTLCRLIEHWNQVEPVPGCCGDSRHE